MPSLEKSLSQNDLGYLNIVAELWGYDLNAENQRQGVQVLQEIMTQEDLLLEVIETLPPESQQALLELARNKGRIPWTLFERKYGNIRQMGPARRDREMPHLAPQSTAEVLFYHGLLGRDFLNSAEGLQEFAYLPDELLGIIQPHLPPETPALSGDDQAAAAAPPPGRPARPEEYAAIHLANDLLLEDIGTLLAALRLGLPVEQAPLHTSADFLMALLRELRLWQHETLNLNRIKAFFESTRPVAFARLTQAWLTADCNDLCMTPNLHCEGTWSYDVIRARSTVIEWLQALPENLWWHLPAFIEAIRRSHPDFLRSGGEYEAWLIRKAESSEYLQGFGSWMDVEGAFLRYLITGPLHWLGVVDLAGPGPESTPIAFRLSAAAADLLAGRPSEKIISPEATPTLNSQGLIEIPRGSDLALRYQIARFTEWERTSRAGYAYRITPASLRKANAQGLTGAHLLALFKRYAIAVPPALQNAIIRWEKQEKPAGRVETGLLLRLEDPSLTQAFKQSRASRFIREQLNANTFLLQPGAREAVLKALAELGWLIEDLP